ncbi:hypothetical protein TrispH2_007146 [Trichoplax sp. H2]|nr:hypothetical protein TrispH2_007146 [Trichoplax sp. H2]|eukprot:RDD40205.1 hypothetical protein TrispH2_007146 [Trichoplax sp. H2]
MEFTNVAASVVSNWLDEYAITKNEGPGSNKKGSSDQYRLENRPFRCGIGAEQLAKNKAIEENHRIELSLQKSLRKSNKSNYMISKPSKPAERQLPKAEDSQFSEDDEDSKVKAVQISKKVHSHTQILFDMQKRKKRNRKKKKQTKVNRL